MNRTKQSNIVIWAKKDKILAINLDQKCYLLTASVHHFPLFASGPLKIKGQCHEREIFCRSERFNQYFPDGFQGLLTAV